MQKKCHRAFAKAHKFYYCYLRIYGEQVVGPRPDNSSTSIVLPNILNRTEGIKNLWFYFFMKINGDKIAIPQDKWCSVISYV